MKEKCLQTRFAGIAAFLMSVSPPPTETFPALQGILESWFICIQLCFTQTKRNMKKNIYFTRPLTTKLKLNQVEHKLSCQEFFS